MKEDTRRKLLEVTLELVSKKGYIGTTTKEIAQRAGVSEITLFRHFGSKESLFIEMLNTFSFLPRLKEIIPKLESISYKQALEEIGIRFFFTLKERKSMIKIILSEIKLYPEKLRWIYNNFINEMIETLGEYFKVLQKQRVLRVFEPKTGARAFLGMIFCYFKSEEILCGKDITKEEAEKIIKEFVDIFVNGTEVKDE